MLYYEPLTFVDAVATCAGTTLLPGGRPGSLMMMENVAHMFQHAAIARSDIANVRRYLYRALCSAARMQSAGRQWGRHVFRYAEPVMPGNPHLCPRSSLAQAIIEGYGLTADPAQINCNLW